MITYLECSCCGDEGAVSDSDGLFYDGQPLICECLGHVSVEEEGDVWISNHEDDPCPKCDL